MSKITYVKDVETQEFEEDAMMAKNSRNIYRSFMLLKLNARHQFLVQTKLNNFFAEMTGSC